MIKDKKIFLGTALWGWGVNQKEAFNLLDHYYDFGLRHIDTALNYPIDKKPNHFGLCLKWLKKWINLNPEKKILITVKIGSLSNNGDTNFNLDYNYIMKKHEDLLKTFPKNLNCISVHWDNRDNSLENESSVKNTLKAFRKIKRNKLNIGFSGVNCPKLYSRYGDDLKKDWVIQVKNNTINSEKLMFYKKYFPEAKYIAYGINGGGIKLTKNHPDSSVLLRKIQNDNLLRDEFKKKFNEFKHNKFKVKTLNELNLYITISDPKINGFIIGPRNSDQLKQSMKFLKLIS